MAYSNWDFQGVAERALERMVIAPYKRADSRFSDVDTSVAKAFVEGKMYGRVRKLSTISAEVVYDVHDETDAMREVIVGVVHQTGVCVQFPMKRVTHPHMLLVTDGGWNTPTTHRYMQRLLPRSVYLWNARKNWSADEYGFPNALMEGYSINIDKWPEIAVFSDACGLSTYGRSLHLQRILPFYEDRNGVFSTVSTQCDHELRWIPIREGHWTRAVPRESIQTGKLYLTFPARASLQDNTKVILAMNDAKKFFWMERDSGWRRTRSVNVNMLQSEQRNKVLAMRNAAANTGMNPLLRLTRAKASIENYERSEVAKSMIALWLDTKRWRMFTTISGTNPYSVGMTMLRPEFAAFEAKAIVTGKDL